MGYTVYLMHYDENIFPDPKNFRPERWLENPQLVKNMFAFSKGTR
jgi:cytochrome P450